MELAVDDYCAELNKRLSEPLGMDLRIRGYYTV